MSDQFPTMPASTSNPCDRAQLLRFASMLGSLRAALDAESCVVEMAQDPSLTLYAADAADAWALCEDRAERIATCDTIPSELRLAAECILAVLIDAGAEPEGLRVHPATLRGLAGQLSRMGLAVDRAAPGLLGLAADLLEEVVEAAIAAAAPAFEADTLLIPESLPA